MTDLNDDILSCNANEYKSDFSGHILEQYKLFRASIVDLQDDRNSNNKLMTTISSGFLTIATILTHFIPTINFYNASHILYLGLLVIPFSGICIGIIWLLNNKSYSTAIKIRYIIIKKIERYLPAKPFSLENEKRDDSSYIHISTLQIVLAILFIFIQTVFLFGIMCFICSHCF